MSISKRHKTLKHTKKTTPPRSKGTTPPRSKGKSTKKTRIQSPVEWDYRQYRLYRTGLGWPTENIAFYKSSGQGNERFKNKFQGTAIPFYGMTIRDSDILIIKSRTLLEESLGIGPKSEIHKIWMPYLLSLVVHDRQIHNINGELLDSSVLDNATISTYYEYVKPPYNHDEYSQDLDNFLHSYFYEWWQLQISASIGTGFWEKYPYDVIRDFVLNYSYEYVGNTFRWIRLDTPFHHIDVTPNDSSAIYRNLETGTLSEINTYLTQHGAYNIEACKQYIINDEYKIKSNKATQIANNTTVRIRQILALHRILEQNKSRTKQIGWVGAK